MNTLENDRILKRYQMASDCPAVTALDVIGGKWKPVIIWLLMFESLRFGELHKAIPGVALKVLSRTLKELENDGIIDRKAYPEVPPRVEYSLTAKGESLREVLQTLADWSRANIVTAPAV